MNYFGNPPPTFPCGHPRSAENTRVNGHNRTCRLCYRAWEAAYRQRTNRNQKEQLRYLSRKLGLTYSPT